MANHRHNAERIYVNVYLVAAMKSLRKLNLNSTYLSALTFEGLKVECFVIFRLLHTRIS